MVNSKYKVVGYSLVVLGVIILIIVGYNNSTKTHTPLVFSERSLLKNVWMNYKDIYIEPIGGRTLDIDNNNITTSEGQSYSLLRSVWMDDKATFDRTLQFTKDNLDRPDDHLYSWLYGQLPDKSYGVLVDQGGENAASDADTDMAMALIFASKRWGDPKYLYDSVNMIDDIWAKEVFTVDGKPYMGADSYEHDASSTAVVNPSYFAPYAYRIFATVDTKHDWLALADNSYELLNRSASSTLDKLTTDGLPPNWFEMNKKTGELTPVASNKNLTTDYGYDAFRIPWRIALDQQWYNPPQAKETLEKFSFLNEAWEKEKVLHPTYTHDGQVVVGGEAPAMYGASMGYFMNENTKNAKEIYNTKLISLYNPDDSAWKNVLSYYDDNWAWFGIALYNNLLPNYAAVSTTQDATSTSSK